MKSAQERTLWAGEISEMSKIGGATDKLLSQGALLEEAADQADCCLRLDVLIWPVALAPKLDLSTSFRFWFFAIHLYIYIFIYGRVSLALVSFPVQKGGSKWGEYLSVFSRRGAEGTSENPFSKQFSQHFRNIMDASRPLWCLFFLARSNGPGQPEENTYICGDGHVYLPELIIFMYLDL